MSQKHSNKDRKALWRLIGLIALSILVFLYENYYQDTPELLQPESTVSSAVTQNETEQPSADEVTALASVDYSDILSEVPAYSGESFCILQDNQPNFSSQEKQCLTALEYYAPLDELGRCGVTYANVCAELMPTEERGDISSIKPTGMQGNNNEYDFVDGGRIYNRCHLIGFQLAGENANKQNLITGTRYMNVDGMLPFENMVADFVKEYGGHVLYRVTPIFTGDNLVADGVVMEAYSVEDGGETVCFNVFCYNVQPGVDIDYTTGENRLAKSKTK